MRRVPLAPLIIAGGIVALMLGASLRAETWTTEFPIDKQDLASTGRNPYFILEPGHYLVLRVGDEELTITVLPETKMVDGVQTRVVEERETKAGKLSEISRNYFAISKRTNDVFYFGEDVDIYEGGKVVSHEGAWLSGVNGAKIRPLCPGPAISECEILPGGSPWSGHGSSRDHQPDRDGQDAGGRVQELFEAQGDKSFGARRHGLQVLRPWHRDGAGRRAETREVWNSSRVPTDRTCRHSAAVSRVPARMLVPSAPFAQQEKATFAASELRVAMLAVEARASSRSISPYPRTALVSSSTNSGTSSVLATISSRTAAGSSLPSVSLPIIAPTWFCPRRFRASEATWE